jgi:hypothetical protein
MAKISSLLMLVRSMTKSEVRYFKMYTSLQQGEKDYLVLFELLTENNDYSDIKNKFLSRKPNASFETASKYLFKVITDCLLHIRLERDNSNKLVVSLLKANILFEKSMYEEGFNELNKLQASCEANEHHLLQLWAIRTELNFNNNLNYYNLKENELVKKQSKIDELLKYLKSIHQHTTLYEHLRYRMLHKGPARTKAQKESLNDIVINELSIVSSRLADAFESQRIHLLFQANYFISVNDFNSALNTFYELTEFLEEHKHLWDNSSMHYISALEGILDTLHSIGRFDDMEYFIDKLSKLQLTSSVIDINVQKITFIYRLISLLNKGQFDEGILLKDEFEDSLFKKLHVLDLTKQAEVFLYTALIYLGKGKIPKAHSYLSKILLESKLFQSLPVFRIFRLIHLLVHFELENHEYISSEVRSIMRTGLLTKGKSYLLEKLIFKFVQTDLPTSHKQKDIYWKKIKEQFSEVKAEKYEWQVIRIFDFQSWIYSRIYKIDFAKVLVSKAAM